MCGESLAWLISLLVWSTVFWSIAQSYQPSGVFVPVENNNRCLLCTCCMLCMDGNVAGKLSDPLSFSISTSVLISLAFSLPLCLSRVFRLHTPSIPLGFLDTAWIPLGHRSGAAWTSLGYGLDSVWVPLGCRSDADGYRLDTCWISLGYRVDVAGCRVDTAWITLG